MSSNTDAVREELQRLIDAKDSTSLGYFLSEHEETLTPEEFENALEVLQTLMDEDDADEEKGASNDAVEALNDAAEEGLEETTTETPENDESATPAAVQDESTPEEPEIAPPPQNPTTQLQRGQETPDFPGSLNESDTDENENHPDEAQPEDDDDFDAELSDEDVSPANTLANEAQKIQQEEDIEHLETKELVENMRRKRIKSLMGSDKRPFLTGITTRHTRNLSTPTDEDLTELSMLSDEDHSQTGSSPPVRVSFINPLQIETSLGTLTITDHDKIPSDEEEDDPVPPTQLSQLTITQPPSAQQDAAYFETVRAEFKRRSFHFMQSNTPLDDYHPLIGKFNLLLVAFNLHLYNNSDIVYISATTPNLLGILTHLCNLLTHRTKMSVFGNTKNLIQIFSRLNTVKEEQLLYNFESIPFVRTMSDTRLQQKIILFLQYLLQKQKLMGVVVELCNNTPVLIECYERDSILHDYNHCHQLVQFLLPKLTVHMYQFDYPPSIDNASVKSVMMQLQQFMKAMIHYIHAQQATQKSIEEICNERDNAYIGTLFRNTICRSLKFILEQNKVKSRWLRQVHLWDIISHMGNTHDGVQHNGIEISTAISTINEVIPLLDSNLLISDSRQLHLDDKCLTFICYCMNYKMFSFFLEKFFKDDALLKKFYSKKQPSLHRNEVVQREMLKYVRVLEKLPLSFMLRI